MIQIRMSRLGFEDRPPITIQCIEEKEQLALLSIEVTDLETKDAYGCPDFGRFDDSIKAALMTYLKDIGISHELAKFAAIYMKNKKKIDFYQYLKNMRAFIREGELERDESDSDDDDDDKKKVKKIRTKK